LKKFIEIDEKKTLKKVALIKTYYEEGRLQPTPAGHPKGELLSTGLFCHDYGVGCPRVLKTTTLETVVWSFQGWPPAGRRRVGHGRL
jgi:hypothetical protein